MMLDTLKVDRRMPVLFKDSCQKMHYVPLKCCYPPTRLHDDRVTQKVTKQIITTASWAMAQAVGRRPLIA
jgi:hypothetical protein